MTSGAPRKADIAVRSPGLSDASIIAQMAEVLALQLGVDLAAIRPCLALIPPQPEHHRSHYAWVLAVEYLRAGASPDVTTAVLAQWAQTCDQPARASHAFTAREAASTVRSAVARKKQGGLRGYGCKRGPLADACPYPVESRLQACPHILRRRRPPRRERLTTLLGAFNHARSLPVPKAWTGTQVARRRYIMLVLGALEVAKGYPGGELITSLRELAYESGLPMRTLRDDLAAMKRARWIEHRPGVSRREQHESPMRGARIRRNLTRGEGLLREALAAFPGVVGEARP